VLLSFFAFAKLERVADASYEALACGTSDLPKSSVHTLRSVLVWAFACAVPLALAGWARPLAMLMLAALVGYLLLFSRHRWLHRGFAAGILLVVFFASGTLSDRLVQRHTGFAPASSTVSFGWNLYVGASAAGTWNDEDAARFNAVMQTVTSPDEVQRYFAIAAVDRYREMGTDILPHMARKLRVWNAHRYVSAFYEGRFTTSVRGAVAVFDLTVFALAVVGGVMILFQRRRNIYFALMFYLAGSVATLMLLEIAPRYVVSYRMIFCLFAAGALHHAYKNGMLPIIARIKNAV